MINDFRLLTAGAPVTRRRLMQSLAAVVAPAVLASRPRGVAAQAADVGPYSPAVLPPGIRSRILINVNGIRMYVLEAGFESANRPGVLFLHDYPELGYS